MDRADEATRDCFNALIQMRRIEPEGSVDVGGIHARLCAYIDAMMRRDVELGFRREDMADIAYAIVALADEIMLSRHETIRQFWMGRLLQLRYFNENLAGENFFVRLNALLADPHRLEVLKVYYLCLRLGFQGRYRMRGGDVELQELQDRVQQVLVRAGALGGEVLSPRGARPQDTVTRTQRGLRLVTVAIVTLGAVIALNVGLRFYLGARAGAAARHISEVATTGHR